VVKTWTAVGNTASTGDCRRRPLSPSVTCSSKWDAIRFAKDTMRNVEAGPDGIEFVAFGAGEDPRDAEMAPQWWTD
jgi:hypothetical protein